MTKGRNAAATNARLRAELAESKEARRRLEARIHEAERERDGAVARMRVMDEEAHPQVLAERKRADDAALEAKRAAQTEREWWRERIEQLLPTWRAMNDACLSTGTGIWTEQSMQAAADLFGVDTLPQSLVTRNHRRNLKDGAAVRKIVTALNEAERQTGQKLSTLGVSNGRTRHAELRERMGLPPVSQHYKTRDAATGT